MRLPRLEVVVAALVSSSSARAMTTTTTVVSLESALQSVAKMPASTKEFVLGSSSSSRRQLLAATGASFEVMVPDIDEKAIGDRANGDAETLVRAVATAKADALVGRIDRDDERVLLTGDQVVTYGGKIREKPADLQECRRFIRSYSSMPCATVGAICLHSLRTGNRVLGVHEASVLFDDIPDHVIDDLVHADGPTLLKCAGGLMVEHPIVAPYVRRVTGGVDSIMGLSTHLLLDLLTQLQTLDAGGGEASSSV